MAKEATPVVECQMMIRKPAATVFQAFIDPEVTTRFWFTKSSGDPRASSSGFIYILLIGFVYIMQKPESNCFHVKER